MSLEKSNRQEEWLWDVGKKVGHGWCNLFHQATAHPNVVIADHGRITGNVLHTEERRVVPSRVQRVEQMLAVIVKGEATMRQPQHAAAMRRLASDQGGPTGRAGGRSAEGLPKQHALIGQLLEPRRGNRGTIWLDRAACIMRMQIQNIGSGHSAPLQIAD
jgi:hypothetical protein